jgi:hypothetical protein
MELKASVPDDVEQVDRFGESASALWDRLSVNAVGTQRSSAFLNWRYASHPVFTYRMLEHRLDGAVAALGVYRLEQAGSSGVGVARVVELIAETTLAPLVRALLADARANGAALVDFFGADSQTSTVLRRSGFIRDDEPFVAQLPILLQPIDRRRTAIPFMAYLPTVGEPHDLDWYVTKGDGDQDRPN